MKVISQTGNRVLIKITDEDVAAGPIIVKRESLLRNVPASIGEIMAVGRGYLENAAEDKWTPCTRKVGEEVLLNKDAGLKIPKEILKYILKDTRADCDYVLVAETQVMAVVDEKETDKKDS